MPIAAFRPALLSRAIVIFCGLIWENKPARCREGVYCVQRSPHPNGLFALAPVEQGIIINLRGMHAYFTHDKSIKRGGIPIVRPSFNFHLLSPLNKVNVPRRFELFPTQRDPCPR